MKTKKFKQAPSELRPTPVHQRKVIWAGALAIGVNLLLFVFKMIISIASGSVAIMSDALHGLVDTFSGIVVIISEKIMPKKAKKRRYNIEDESSATDEADDAAKTLTHADIERIGTRIIAVIILLVAVHLLVETIENFVSSEEVVISAPVAVILVIAMVTKIALGLYLRRTGKRVKSETLLASSVETLNDSIISGAVLISSLVYLWWQIDIDALMSLIVVILIVKSGIDLLISTKTEKI